MHTSGLPKFRFGCGRVAAVAGGLTLFAGPALAALSPYWETAAEMKAVLSDPGVADALKSQDPIISVIQSDVDVYAVTNGTCTVTVNVVDKPRDASKPMMVGPRQFALKIGQTTCP